MRVVAKNGISNPIFFLVDNLNETREIEPNDDHFSPALKTLETPILVNGQILPGDIDHFSFAAKKATQL